MEPPNDDEEMEAAVLDAIRAANANDAYPAVDELSAILIHRGVAASEVAAAADRLYRSIRISVSSAGGLRAPG